MKTQGLKGMLALYDAAKEASESFDYLRSKFGKCTGAAIDAAWSINNAVSVIEACAYSEAFMQCEFDRLDQGFENLGYLGYVVSMDD